MVHNVQLFSELFPCKSMILYGNFPWPVIG